MADFNSQTVLALTANASIQSVGDGAVVLLADSGQLFSCNETTEAFIVKVDGKRSFGEIVALFGEEFDVDEAVANEDLAQLAQMLVDEEILETV